MAVLDGALEMGSSLPRRQHVASVRVKDGGVRAARNLLTFKVFSSLWKSRLTFSVTGDGVLLTVKILHSFMISQRKKRNRFPAQSFPFEDCKQDGPEFKPN